MFKTWIWKKLSQNHYFLFFFLWLLTISKGSSHQRCSVKKGVLENFAKFTGKHQCQSLFFNKVAGASGLQLYEKRDSGTGVFLLIRNLLSFFLFIWANFFLYTYKWFSNGLKPTRVFDIIINCFQKQLSNFGLIGCKYLIKIIFDIEIKIDIFEISNVPI